MSTTTDVTVHSIADVPWDDVRTVFGTRGDPSTCWCQYFKLSKAAFDAATREECADMLRHQVRENQPAPGVIAYLDGDPVGWCAVEPKTHYDRLRRSTIARQSAEDPDDAYDWAVTCFVVRVGIRKRGVGGALLRGAVEQACGLGARVVAGYPVDTSAREKAPSAELYHGTLSLFSSAGFEVVARPTRDRAVVRIAL
jgi:GNAT superfamily N-acetyltransferase